MADNIQTPRQDRLLHAALIPGELHDDYTQSPPVYVEIVWLASRDRVEVGAYDARKPPSEPPFYSETVEKVKDAERLWERIVGSGVAWGRQA